MSFLPSPPHTLLLPSVQGEWQLVLDPRAVDELHTVRKVRKISISAELVFSFVPLFGSACTTMTSDKVVGLRRNIQLNKQVHLFLTTSLFQVDSVQVHGGPFLLEAGAVRGRTEHTL